MADDVMIKATAGPYKGKRLTVSEADAKAAIKDGWAVDPFAEPAEAKELSEEDRAKIAAKATEAAARLRGEAEAAKAGKTETRAMEAEDSAEYQTRSTKARK